MAHARNTSNRLARTAILGGLHLPSLCVCAQEAGAAAAEVVHVSGTRITSPGASAGSPILSVNADELRAAQAVAVEEFFKDLPGAAPASGPATNLGSIGGATIDLRGLGANRTLVLIDGRRLVPFNLGGTVDTNTIPLALLSRVDVLTGGASAVYGADAVAGVANFRLRRRVQGVELFTSYGKSSSGDTVRQRTGVTAGTSWNQGRGNIVFTVDKTKTSPLFQGERSFGASSLDSVNAQPAGSGTTAPPALVSVPRSPGGSDALAGNWQLNPASGALVQPVVLYNFNPLNYYVTGLRRTQSTVLANYIVSEQTELYLDLFHTSSSVGTTLAEAGTALNVYNVPIGNPFIPEPMRQQVCARRGIPAALCVMGNPTSVGMTLGRRFIEMGRRANDFDNQVLQYTIGAKGALPYGWQYDAYWNRGRSDQLQSRRDYGSYSRVNQALNTTNCVDPSNSCVPLNVFGPVGTVTPAMIEFFNLDSLLQQSVRQDVAAVTLSGDLATTSPWSGQPLNLAIALERRGLQAYSVSDLASQLQGEVLGSATPTPDRAGRTNMRELSLEALVPLVRERPGIHHLNLSFAYRHTEFSAAQNRQRYASFKYGGEWAPVSAMRLRAMLQQAARAPNINELFAPQASNALANLAVDPCQLGLVNQAQAQVAGTLSHLCLLSGVPLPVIGNLPKPSAGQVTSQSSGNPNLSPEQAQTLTLTLGLVLEPQPNLTLSLDHYRIAIDQALSRPAVSDVLDACYSQQLNPSLSFNSWCALIQRSPSNGTFNGNDAAGVRTPLSNQGRQASSGFDLNVRYRLNLSELGSSSNLGNLDLQLVLNQVQKYAFQATPLSLNRQCLGYYSTACGGPNYRRKFSQRSTWNIGRYAIGYHWRYLSGAVEEPGGIDFLPAFAKIAPFHYLDVSLAWNISNAAHVYLSVGNVFNRMPPIVGGTIGTTATNSGNTFPQNYDVVGRYFTLGTTLKF
jgi:iron complex outermembrane receptor protein